MDYFKKCCSRWEVNSIYLLFICVITRVEFEKRAVRCGKIPLAPGFFRLIPLFKSYDVLPPMLKKKPLTDHPQFPTIFLNHLFFLNFYFQTAHLIIFSLFSPLPPPPPPSSNSFVFILVFFVIIILLDRELRLFSSPKNCILSLLLCRSHQS